MTCHNQPDGKFQAGESDSERAKKLEQLRRLLEGQVSIADGDLQYLLSENLDRPGELTPSTVPLLGTGRYGFDNAEGKFWYHNEDFNLATIAWLRIGKSRTYAAEFRARISLDQAGLDISGDYPKWLMGFYCYDQFGNYLGKSAETVIDDSWKKVDGWANGRVTVDTITVTSAYTWAVYLRPFIVRTGGTTSTSQIAWVKFIDATAATVAESFADLAEAQRILAEAAANAASLSEGAAAGHAANAALAEANAQAALVLANDAVILAQNEAQTAIDKALEAAGSSDTAAGFANTASSAANTATGAASAAQASAVAAQSSADGADLDAQASATSAQSAATSATDSEASAAAAQIARVAAESARDAASGSATAAADSAATAGTHSSDAGNYAGAAQTSATNAATEAGNASNFADAASTSAGNASTSATQASTSASNAAGSASTASTQATNAANSATASGNSATAAAGSADTASTSATNAGASATSASTSANTASIKAGEASSSAAAASSSAASASNSASSASISSSLSSTFQKNSANSNANDLPVALDPWKYVRSASGGAPSSFGFYPEEYPSLVPADNSYIDVTGDALSVRGVCSVGSGEVWHLNYRATTIESPGNAGGSVMFYFRYLDEDYNFLSNSGVIGLSTGAHNVEVSGSGYMGYTADTEGLSDRINIPAISAGVPVKYVRMLLLTNRVSGSATVQAGTVRVRQLSAVRYDAEANANRAEAQASAAAASATTATNQAATATTQAGLAATYRTEALGYRNTASTHATTATNQATSATNSAAAASASASLAASVATGHINPNSRFSDYPDGTNIPAGWINWAGVNADKVRIAGLGSSPYAVQCVAQAAATGGFYRNNIGEDEGSIKAGNWYVVEAEVVLGAGTFNGAGVYLLQRNGTTSGSSIVRVSFTGEDAAGTPVGSGVVGKKYRFAHIFQAAAPSTDNFLLYAMNHWSTFSTNVNNGNANAGNISVYNRIHWHMLGVREANPAEVATQTVIPPLQATVSAQASAIANLNGITSAYYGLKLDAGGTVTAIELMATGAGVSKITFTAAKTQFNGDVIIGGTVTATQLASNSVTSAKIAAGNVTATELGTGSVTNVKIGTNAVTSAKIAAGNVTATELGTNSVTEVKISNGAITANKVAANAITAAKIAANTITAAQLSTGLLITASAQIGNGIITTAKIGNLQVDTLQIAGGAVTANQVVTSPDIGVNASVNTTVFSSGWIYVGDANYSSTIVNVNFTFNAALANQYDASARFALFVDLDDGMGFTQHRLQTLGVGTNSGDSYSRMSGQLQTVIQADNFRLVMHCHPSGWIQESVARNVRVEDIVMTVIGAKR